MPQIFISICSLVVSLTAMLLTLFVNARNLKTKKHELSSSEKQRILSWYGETVESLILLRHKAEFGEEYKKSELAHLSALIEMGRYFFPNVDKLNEQSKSKPVAFQGYRQAILTVLILSYNILIKDDANKYISDLYKLQKVFTSGILEIVKPDVYAKSLEEQTGMRLDTDMTFVDFLNKYSEKHHQDYADFKRIFEQHKERDMAETLETKD